jgi:hypothetical protein
MAYTLITNYDSPAYTPALSVAATFGYNRDLCFITIHWWGDPAQRPSFEGTVAYLCRQGGNTSAHEVIEAGRVAVIVAHANAAWHAGNAQGNAQSVGLELNPRASEQDYLTAAERIRDIRALHGKDLPLRPHRSWTSTSCPGVYDLDKLDRLARAGASFGAPTPAPAVSAPAPVPAAPSGKRLTLPAAATGWNVYPLNRPPVAGNEVGRLNPSLFGGLTYDVVRMNQANVAVIRTRDWGEVQIYVGAETGAVLSGSVSAPAVTPVRRVDVIRTAGAYGVKHRTSATTAAENVKAVYGPGTALHVSGWVTGQFVNGSNAWLVGALSGGYMHVSGFANQDLNGLPKLN